VERDITVADFTSGEDRVELWIGNLGIDGIDRVAAYDSNGDGRLTDADRFVRVSGGALVLDLAGAGDRNLEATVAFRGVTSLAIGTDVGFEVDGIVRVGRSPGETLTGRDLNDVLLGLAGNDVVAGNGGDDDVEGGAGNDRLDGGRGNDLAAGGAGDDRVRGGDGDDILVGSTGDNTLDGGSGFDIADYRLAEAAVLVEFPVLRARPLVGPGFEDRLIGIEQVIGSVFGDSMRGGAGEDRLSGDEGRDRLAGRGGGDTLHGDEGRDLVWGGDGKDFLGGGEQADTVFGGAGDDHIEDGLGRDLLYGGGGNDDILLFDVYSEAVENRCTLFGGAGSDRLQGFFVESTSLVMFGDDGHDRIHGAPWQDTVHGGNGDDALRGGAGDDLITGGAGRDHFNFFFDEEASYTEDGRDLVRDFARGTDVLGLSLANAEFFGGTFKILDSNGNGRLDDPDTYVRIAAVQDRGETRASTIIEAGYAHDGLVDLYNPWGRDDEIVLFGVTGLTRSDFG
jgi:Ca2+-binding RTX toxin-like protein